MLKVTSRTPQHKIIETVLADFGVNINYRQAAQIRADMPSGYFEWTNQRFGVKKYCDIEDYYLRWTGIWEIESGFVVEVTKKGKFAHTIDEWNALHPTVTLRRRPSWYVATGHICDYEWRTEEIVSGPYDSRAAACSMLGHNAVELYSRSIITCTEAKRLGLLEND